MREKKGFTFLQSYLIVAGIVLLFTMAGYIYSMLIVNSENNVYYSEILRKEQTFYDQNFRLIDACVTNLTASIQHNELMQVESWGAKESLSSSKIQNELTSYMSSDVYGGTVGIYLCQSHAFYVQEGRYANELDYLKIKHYDMTIEEFESQLVGTSGFFMMADKSGNNLVFYHNFYDSSYRHKLGSTFYILPETYVKQCSDGEFYEEGGGFTVISDKNQIIYDSHRKLTDSTADMISTFVRDKRRKVRIDDEKYLFLSVESEVYALTYGLYIPQKIFYRDIYLFQHVLLLIFTTSILFGLILARYYAKSNTQVLDKMLTLMKGNMEDSIDPHAKKTLNYLEHIMHNYIKDQKSITTKLTNQLSDQDEIAKVKTIEILLRGERLTEQWMISIYNSLREQKQFQNYRVIVFSFPDITKSIFYTMESKEHKERDRDLLLLFATKNVIDEELLGKVEGKKATDRGMTIKSDDKIICILNTENNDSSLRSAVERCVDFLGKAFILSSFVTVSTIHHGCEEFTEAYEETAVLLKHKRFWGNSVNNILYYEDERDTFQDENENLGIIEEEKKLYNYLIVHEYKEASSVLESMVNCIFSKNVSKLFYNQCQAWSIVSLLLNVVDTSKDSKKEDIYHRLGLPERLYQTQTLDELKNDIHLIFHEITSEYENQSRKNAPDWIEKVENYVNEFYADTELNVSKIADIYSLNQAYMGRTFKKYTGVSLLDYIHIVRMKQCEILLLQGKTVQQCAEATGYLDAKNFIRTFKRYKGMTPGQFRQYSEEQIEMVGD